MRDNEHYYPDKDVLINKGSDLGSSKYYKGLRTGFDGASFSLTITNLPYYLTA